MNTHNSQLLTRNSQLLTRTSPLDSAANAAVSLLEKYGVWRRTPNGKGALDSVEAALDQGWTGKQCLNCVEAWLAYANTHAGRWVQCPGIQAAARLRDLQMPAPAPDQEQASRYITGKYAAFILHDEYIPNYLFHPKANNFPCPECGKPTGFDEYTEQSYCANPTCRLFMRTIHPSDRKEHHEHPTRNS